MGGAASKAAVEQEFETLVANKSDINILNEQLNDVQIETIMKDAQTCSAAITQDQLQRYKGIKSMGKLTFTIKQKQASNLTFSCLNLSKVRNDIANQMTSNIMTNLESTTDTEILNKMGAAAAAKAEAGEQFFPWGGADTENNIKQITKTTNVTENTKNIQHIVKNAIENTFTVDNVKTCVNSVSNIQSITFEDVQGEEIDFVIDQNQAATLLAECINKSDVSQDLTNGLLEFFEVSTKEEATTVIQTQAEAEAIAEAKKTGLIGDLFDGITKTLDATIGKLLDSIGMGNVFGGMTPSLSSSSSCICCILIIVALIFVLGFLGVEGEGGEGVEAGVSATSPEYYVEPTTQQGGHYGRWSATSPGY